ncbi:MAG: translocation/assembly module TamB domain-containing protein [Chitinophagaceae bacterium]|nr:translocation/assembly module TamB domain-containing protein [Chitinophagaceae bacterium]
MANEKATTKHRTLAGKILRIVFRTLLIIVLIFATIALLIITPPVQNFIRQKATAWLSSKLNTTVSVGRIYIGFPKKVVLENIYVEDLQKDTLLSGGLVKVDVSMMKLLKNELEINDVQLSDITAKVKRVLPDTVYNFQFIIDAFATADTTQKTPADTTGGMRISVRDVALDKIRIVYDDVVTESDMTLWLEHFDTQIDEFDSEKLRFNVPETNLKGIRANIYQRKPLMEPAEITRDTAQAAPTQAIDLEVGTFNASDIHVDYGNDVSAFYTKLDLGTLALDADDLDMQNQVVKLDGIRLDNTTAQIKLGKTGKAKLVAEDAKQETQQAQKGWRVEVKEIQLNNNNLAFTNDNEPAVAKGMDYAHLDAKGVTLHAEDFLFDPDSIAGKITKGQLSEKSGFRLNTLQTQFLYAFNQAYLHDLLLETPGTTLRRSAEIKYPSIEALQKDLGKMQLNVDLDNSKIQVKDLLTFAPMLAEQPAFSNPEATWTVNGEVNGSVANMNIGTLQLSAFNNTVVDIKGKIAGLPDGNKVAGNLSINKIQTSGRDLRMFIPKGALPSTITLPEVFNLSGTVAGSMRDAKGKLNLSTDLGNVAVDGSIKNATDKNNADYNATVNTRNVKLGTIMQNDSMFGDLTATVKASGKGFDQKTAAANINAVINSVVYNRYTYKDINFKGDLANQVANFALNIKDPNLTIDLDGESDISGEFPTIALNAVIDSINTKPLNLTPDTIIYKGTITADFKTTDPANPDGELKVVKSALTMNNQRYPFDSISVIAGKSDSGKFVRFSSDVMSAELSGEYNLAQLGAVFQRSIQPYYALVADSAFKDTLQNYDFKLKANIVDGPLLKAFLPTLTRIEPVNISGRFTTNDGWNMHADAPLVLMGVNRIQKFSLNAGTNNNSIRLVTGIEQFSSGTSMNIYESTLTANVADNKINFLVNLKDVEKKNKYRLGGQFDQSQDGALDFKLYRDSLLLNYDKWLIAENNLIRMNKGDVNVTNFNISNDEQQLSINSQSRESNSPIDIKLGKFKISTITAFAKQDTALVDGVINGAVMINNIATQPTFTSDITITDLTVQADTVGNLALKVNNSQANIFTADVSLTGKGNDIGINGTYQVKPENQSVINLVLDIRKLQMTSVQAFSFGAIDDASGFVNGRFDIAGTFDKPDINGNIKFNQAALRPAMLGSYFRIDQEKIDFDNAGIHFKSFTILDTAKNKLTLNGDILTSNFINYKLDLDISAKNFEALNSTKQNNKLFYGQFYFDTDLHVTGTELRPSVNGRLTVNDKTKFTVVLPQTQPGVEDREGVIRFVDMDSVRMDTSLLLTQVDSLATSDVKGMDISVNIEVNKNAELTLIVDEANGDFLRMKGTAQLTGGIDPSGKVTLTGSYEIEEGAYQLSLNLLQRKFQIQKGSKIVWLGEPTRADVNLTAVYVAKTAPLTLVENQTQETTANQYKQKLPFNVQLILTGELLKPEIKFDITLPEQTDLRVDAQVIETVDTRLTQLRGQPSELNKQVFALLLLNRFVAENPFASGAGGGGGVESMARQSVSKLLTEQLNNLAADLISGVELNFDVASTEDYTTGEMQNRTDLNVSLSKQLLNDRLRVTVGSNFELEGPQQASQRQNNLAGNVALDYLLSKDGRYLLRAYRKNEYEGALEGYIIETGVNFILSFDYDSFHELLRRRGRPSVSK